MGDLCSASSALAMAAPWEDVLRDEAAIQEAASVAVDAALLEGVLMRTEREPNASDVSAGAESRDEFDPGRAVCESAKREEGGEEPAAIPGFAAPWSASTALRRAAGRLAEAGLKHDRPGGCNSHPILLVTAPPLETALLYGSPFPRRGIDLERFGKLPGALPVCGGGSSSLSQLLNTHTVL